MADPVDFRFWKKEGDDIAESVNAYAKAIEGDQEYRRQEDLLHASLYGDVQLLGFTPSSYAKPIATKGSLSLNVVRNMTGACVSRVACKAKPRPTFATNYADWEMSRRARKLQRAVEGTFNRTKFYPKSNLVFRDGCIFGSGHIFWGAHFEAKRVFCQRMLPGEWLVDDRAGLYGDESVKVGVRSRWFDKVVLAEQFPEDEAFIMNSKSSEEDGGGVGYDAGGDQILVREAYRLPSWTGAKDGMFARCIPGKVLGEPRKITRDRFPVATWRWDDALAGYYGKGLAHELVGIQLSINDILDEIDDLLHTVKGKWLVEEFSRVDTNELNDEGDAIVLFRGTAPIYITPQVVPPEMYQHLWNLVSRAYEITGIGQMAATSAKPAGLNSGEAQRVFRDNQSERMLSKFESWDAFIMQNAELAVDALRDLSEVHGDLVISTRRGHARDVLKFKEIDLAEDSYELELMPTSMLPTTPSGKIAFAEDMTKWGVVDAEELLEVIQMPDTDRLVERKLATRKLVEEMLEDIIETGEFTPPEPFMFWPTAMKVSVESYLTYRRDKCPPDRLDLIARWIVLARLMMKKQMAEDAPPLPMPPPMPPPGMGPPPMMGPGMPPALPPGGEPGVPPSMAA